MTDSNRNLGKKTQKNNLKTQQLKVRLPSLENHNPFALRAGYVLPFFFFFFPVNYQFLTPCDSV